ncbi:hypothetical protein HNQ88_001565 [Aureibacter tunicatorum]|uniref:Uncharacterized protein n=1 Tax=Aureibacter tunicatorum TaxID=866807 RepID=A0AAE4BS55_9BACT|nr:hypothetical protein [Aureibacter tunicatorum]BDD05540.1 hypothetical protein AUTU_30230 [Aureibacter tunicatorum]
MMQCIGIGMRIDVGMYVQRKIYELDLAFIFLFELERSI